MLSFLGSWREAVVGARRPRLLFLGRCSFRRPHTRRVEMIVRTTLSGLRCLSHCWCRRLLRTNSRWQAVVAQLRGRLVRGSIGDWRADRNRGTG
jgi:hypothetical protein